MKTNVLTPEGRATDETQIEHGYGDGLLYKEAKKTGNKEQKASGGWQMWVGEWVKLGKGGQGMGKRNSLARIEPVLTRLGPDKSMQVVDFPCMYNVRSFGEIGKNHRDTKAQGRPRCVKCYGLLRKSPRSYAKFHESSHRSGPWLRDVTHFYGWDLFFDHGWNAD
jgi:hypothetical protein